MTILGDILRQIRVDGEQTGYFAEKNGARRGFFAAENDLALPQDCNVWFSLNPGHDAGQGRVTIETVSRLAALHADLDVGGAGKTIPSPAAAKSIVDQLSEMLGSQPIAVIFSGHGYQPIWAVEPEPFAGAEATALLKRWGALVQRVAGEHGGQVDSVFELARLVRAPGSVNHKSTPVAATATPMPGRPLTLDEIREALDAYSPAPEPMAAAVAPLYAGPTPEQATPMEVKVVADEVARLDALPRPWHDGANWDSTIFQVATTLTEFANSSWTVLTHDDVARLIAEHAPCDDRWDERRAKLTAGRKKAGGQTRPAPRSLTGQPDNFITAAAKEQGILNDDGTLAQAVTPSPGSSQIIPHDRTVDVSNPALAARWLMSTAGAGGLSGMFFRKGEVVHTAAVGEEGFIEVKDTRAESAASISAMSSAQVRARITTTHQVVKMALDTKATKAARANDENAAEVYKPKPALFPLEAADILVQAPDLASSLRVLNGVVHTPTVRPDGSIITTPGYDRPTGLLYLPVGAQPSHIPDEPTIDDVDMARKCLNYMLQDFSFVSEHDKASYLGLMLTPLLRTMVPPPYKLGVIEAHQPGSGKSYLARALTSIHGGLEQSGLAPTDEELGKAVGAILDTQTAPVIVFDNVDGMVRSPLLAGLLTSPTFSMRRLGSSTRIEANNDRLWIMTANNATLSGDLGRRNIRVRIDPGVPNPERRTDFVIADFEGWTRQHRSDLLWALLVLVRNWVQRGRPIGVATKDSYGSWISVLRGILQCAGIPGLVDDPSTHTADIDPEADEFAAMLVPLRERLGDNPWTVKQLLKLVAHPAMPNDPSRPIPYDVLPEWLTAKQRGPAVDPVMLARPLGNGIRYRQGRYFGELAIVSAGQDAKSKVQMWRIRTYN